MLFIDSCKKVVNITKSSFDETVGGFIGFPTLMTIFVKNGTKNLNLTNLCELIIATGNNNF